MTFPMTRQALSPGVLSQPNVGQPLSPMSPTGIFKVSLQPVATRCKQGSDSDMAQEKKLWRGKGLAPGHTEIRAVAEAAVADGLKTQSLGYLVHIVEPLCRETSLRAAREKRDKALQLKRAYFNAVTEVLEGRLMNLSRQAGKITIFHIC